MEARRRNLLMRWEMNQIIENLKSSQLDGCTLIGALENAMTSAVNSADPVGGWSVDIRNDEIFIYQHPDAGDGEMLITF
jgi:hypothetical protein